MNLNSWPFFAIGAAFFAALTAIFGKIGLQTINSNVATFFRTIIVIFVSIGIITYRSEWPKLSDMSWSAAVPLILSGIATGLSWHLYYKALQLGPLSKVVPVDKLSVPFAIIISMIFLGERLTVQSLIGATLIIIGSIVLVYSN